MAVIRKIKLQKACYQAVTKATTKNSHSNDRFGFIVGRFQALFDVLLIFAEPESPVCFQFS